MLVMLARSLPPAPEQRIPGGVSKYEAGLGVEGNVVSYLRPRRKSCCAG